MDKETKNTSLKTLMTIMVFNIIFLMCAFPVLFVFFGFSVDNPLPIEILMLPVLSFILFYSIYETLKTLEKISILKCLLVSFITSNICWVIGIKAIFIIFILLILLAPMLPQSHRLFDLIVLIILLNINSFTVLLCSNRIFLEIHKYYKNREAAKSILTKPLLIWTLVVVLVAIGQYYGVKLSYNVVTEKVLTNNIYKYENDYVLKIKNHVVTYYNTDVKTKSKPKEFFLNRIIDAYKIKLKNKNTVIFQDIGGSYYRDRNEKKYECLIYLFDYKKEHLEHVETIRTDINYDFSYAPIDENRVLILFERSDYIDKAMIFDSISKKLSYTEPIPMPCSYYNPIKLSNKNYVFIKGNQVYHKDNNEFKPEENTYVAMVFDGNNNTFILPEHDVDLSKHYTYVPLDNNKLLLINRLSNDKVLPLIYEPETNTIRQVEINDEWFSNITDIMKLEDSRVLIKNIKDKVGLLDLNKEEFYVLPHNIPIEPESTVQISRNKILVFGGKLNESPFFKEIGRPIRCYDLKTGEYKHIGNMRNAYVREKVGRPYVGYPAAFLQNDGKILITGDGHSELFDPSIFKELQ